MTETEYSGIQSSNLNLKCVTLHKSVTRDADELPLLHLKIIIARRGVRTSYYDGLHCSQLYHYGI